MASISRLRKVVVLHAQYVQALVVETLILVLRAGRPLVQKGKVDVSAKDIYSARPGGCPLKTYTVLVLVDVR